MAGPMKGMGNPSKNTNAFPATKTIPAVPGKRIPQVNENRVNTVPDGEICIPWPKAPGVDHNPIKK